MKKILIVEDETDMREVLRMNLKESGFDCVAIGLGEPAIDLSKNESPDLIILDLMLPDMPGEEVCRQIRGDPVTKEIPIVMFTAKDKDADRVLGRVIGADAYICKPCGIDDLIASINKLIK